MKVKNNPKISIIIPNYNNGKYIVQCVESIETQTYSPIEVVIVDDVSTDNSKEIIGTLAQKYDNVVPHFLDSNSGVSNARNIGAEISTGEYLCFLDPDDFFYAKDKLEREMSIIQKHKRAGKKVMAYSGVVCVNEAGESVDSRGLEGQLEGNILAAYLARYKDDKHPRNVLFDREVFTELSEGGFNTSMSFWEDDDLFIRLLFHRNIYFTGVYGTAYRWKNTGLSHRSREESEIVQKELEKKYYKELGGTNKLKYRYYKVLRFFYVFKREVFPQWLHEGSVIKHRILRWVGIEK